MDLRRADRCSECGVELPAGTKAYWLPAKRVAQCLACYGRSELRLDTEVPPVVTNDLAESSEHVAQPLGPADDNAGRSARAEYARRSERERALKERQVAEDAEWRRSVRAKRPVLGRIASVLTPRPVVGPESQATTAWNTGAEGEERVAEVLAGVSGIEVLHDRRVPGTRANITTSRSDRPGSS